MPDATEESTYCIDPTATPKQLDLTPVRGEDRTTRRCLYSLMGDELRIASTLEFAPMPPEKEKQRAKELKQRRPGQIDPKRTDVLVLTFKRKK
jgi:hypothetical protein